MGRTEAKSGQAAKRPMAATSGASLPRDVSVLSIVADLEGRDLDGLRRQWRAHLGGEAPAHLPRWLLIRVLAYRLQSDAFGDLDKSIRRNLRSEKDDGAGVPFDRRAPQTRQGIALKAGALLVREWKGRLERVMILEEGFAWNGQTFGSLSQIAKAMTGTNWNGHRFFGLRQGKVDAAGQGRAAEGARPAPAREQPMAHRSETRPDEESDDQAGLAMCNLRASRPTRDLSRTSIPSTLSVRRPRPTSRARLTRAGGWSGTVMTMAAFLAARWIGRHCRNCSSMCRPDGSTSSSSIRSIG